MMVFVSFAAKNNEKIRYPYFELNDLERAYHDKEWGTPCRNDHARFCFRYKELKRMK